MTRDHKSARVVSPQWQVESRRETSGNGAIHFRGLDYPSNISITLTLEPATAVARYELSDAGVECVSVEVAGAVEPTALARLAADVQALAVPIAREQGIALRDVVPADDGSAPAVTKLERQLVGGESAGDYELRLVAIAYCDPAVLERPANRRNRNDRVRLTMGYGSGAAAMTGKQQARRRVNAAQAAGLIPGDGASDDELTAAWMRLTGFDAMAESSSE